MSGSLQYNHRYYRAWHAGIDLERFELRIEESDLLILCDRVTTPIKETAQRTLRAARADIKQKIQSLPKFGRSLTPIQPEHSDVQIVRQMNDAGQAWSVGPMAAVAGVIAQAVAHAISPLSRTVIVENGGDIYAVAPSTIRFALYAGEESPFKNALTFEVDASTGMAICTSSKKVGPSLSFGHADAVVAIHHQGGVADAAATALANRIRIPSDIDSVIEQIAAENSLIGIIACMADTLGLWGDLTLVK